MAYETISTSSSSSSLSKEWSFRSITSSSSTISNNGIINTNNNLLSHLKNNNNIDEQIIPYPHHPYYHCITTLKTPNHHHITCLAVHNNLLYAASGNQITTFDLATLSPSPTPYFNGHDLSSGGFIKSIAFYGDNKILTAHQDSKIRVWKRHRFVTTLPTLKDKMRRFISAKNYVQVRRHKRKLWIEHNDAISGLTIHNGVVYSVSWDKTLKIWRAKDFKCLESITAHDDAVNSVTVSDNGTVYTASADGKIRVWQKKVQDNNSYDNDKVWRHCMVSTMHKHGSTVNALALSRNGRVLLSGGCDGIIMAWEKCDDHDGDGDGDQMVENGVVGGHDGAVLCLIRLDHDFGDDYEMFVSGGADRTVKIWGRVKRGDGVECRGLFCCMGVLEGHDKPVRSVTVVNQSGENGVVLICSGSLDGEIKVWRVLVYQLIKNYMPPLFN